MAEWKKVIVSGSSAELSSLSLDTALTVANGGTGASTLTDGGVLLGSGTGAITATAVLSNGQLLIGDNSGDPTVGTLSEGNGITVTNGAGSITLAIDGTDAVTFSNNASIFSGSFSGSSTGDGSNLTGISADSFDFDSLDAVTTLNQGDIFGVSGRGTEKKITSSNLEDDIFGNLSGDVSVAAGGAVSVNSVQANSVALGTDTTGNYVQSLANATNGGTTITNGSAEGGAATVALNLNDLSAAAVTVANDSIAIIDANDSNATRKESIADLATAMASTGITATNGVFTTNDSEIDHDSLSNFSADEHFTQANITTVGTVTTGDVSAILPSGTVSASAFSSPSQGTVRATINGVQTDVDLGLQTGDSPQFTNLTVSGDLTVQGTTTTLQTTNLSIEDQFITIASGSQSATDGGFIVSKQADGAGFAIGYDTATTRWVLDADLAVDATGIVADAYLSTIEVSVSAPSAAPIYGGASNGYGNMHVKTDTGDIYIYA